MNEIEKKALELVNDVCAERGAMPHSEVDRSWNAVEALCRAIEQHEASKQDVSDALLEYYGGYHNASGEPLERFIIPKPTPDPLVRVVNEVIYAQPHGDIDEARTAADIREALAKRGLKIVEDV